MKSAVSFLYRVRFLNQGLGRGQAPERSLGQAVQKRPLGQAAIEYMMIISITLVIMIPLLFLVNSYMAEGKDELRVRALEDSVNSLAEVSDMVYFQGYPAKMTMNFYVPEGVVLAEANENLLRVRIRTSSGNQDIVSFTQANLTGSLPTNSGTYRLSIAAQEDGLVNVSY